MESNTPQGIIDKNFYNNIKKNESLIFCDECKFEWRWKDTVLLDSEYESPEKDKFFVVSFKCKQCGKEYIIAVNNGVTISEIKELRRIEKSLANVVAKSKGKPTPKYISDYNSLVEKHKRVTTRIKKHQDHLKEVYLNVKPGLNLVEVKESKYK